MLRSSLRSVRALGGTRAAVARAQWPASSVGAVTRRYFADEKKPTTEAAKPTVPPPPPPKPKKGIFRRLRNFLVTLVLLGAVGFGGGVWYARINDKFHDLFTEYIPFGEQAVLYLEELDFRRKFPDGADRVSTSNLNDKRVTVAPLSGASWRVADGGEPVGRRSSAVDKAKAVKAAAKKEAEKAKDVAEAVVTAPAVAAAKAVEPEPEPKKEEDVVPASQVSPPAEPAFRAPEVNEPSRFPPLAPIDPLKVNDAKEPIVQDLVHMLNDLITVINADKAHGRYGTTITKAKNDLAKVGRKIQAMKDQIEQKAAAEVKSKIDEFDQAANALVSRVESAMVAQERQWRQEFEEEMTRVRASYEDKVQLLLEREKKLHEEQLNTKLVEQALALKKEFVAEVKDHVEKERDGRLGKLKDLSSAIKELENLTTGWNDVVDLNIQTQQLHVAVEAVRASLQDAQHPRPFIKELVALKQIANGDGVVDAAIASINPSAYQKDISTPAQLIDRFRRVAGEVRKASLLPEDAGVASHATSWALSKVMFKKDGLAAGDDVESILTRTQTYLEEGDLDSAAREMNGLDGWAKTLSRDWLSEVRKVLEVQQALEVIATEARLQSLRTE
ncbi:hypothetical protein jhhlp_005272 [Lomentospora prolificans]|uniref:MICOS complex subunit MIC60 n=1 Tax=Lomentospora prolificans TaxID=41688 RepID=A0A2N3N7B5_9PEZI|nr:hypothetical protein jhhlp_005272 [Lomentospora prolificans]